MTRRSSVRSIRRWANTASAAASTGLGNNMRQTMTIVRKRQSGMSLVEVLAGLAIVSVMVLGTVTVMSNAHNLTRMTSSKEFATQKAISMIEELKSLVQTNTGSTIVTLD